MGPARNSGATYAVSSQSGTTCAVCRGDIKPKRATQLDIQMESAAGQLSQMFSKETWILWADCIFFLWQSIKKILPQIHVLYRAVQPPTSNQQRKRCVSLPLLLGGRLYQGIPGLQEHPRQNAYKLIYVTDVDEHSVQKFSEATTWGGADFFL